MKKIYVLVTCLFFVALLPAQDAFLEVFLKNANDNQLNEVLRKPEQFQLQLIYTQIDRDQNNVPSFKSYTYQVDSNLYFYPASTVKMPTAALALEKINTLNIAGLDKYTPMFIRAGRPPQTEVDQDSSAANTFPSLAHYIKKIFLVSDNDAYNRLYEFLGQAYLNNSLYKKGYQQSRIIHRLSVGGFDVEGNRYTNPIRFYDKDSLLYDQEQVYSAYQSKLKLKEQVRGVARMDGEGNIIPEPFDFRYKNFVALQDLHDILKAIMFPDAIPEGQGFNLSQEDYQLLWKYMSMLPRESDYPAYPQYKDWDSFVKFFLFGNNKDRIPDHIKIFNKVGDAYGFLTDVAYIVDLKNGVEFMLAANIHVNKNQTYNDGVYEYDEIGFPILANLGRLFYEYELKRERKVKPDFGYLDK